MGGRRGAAGIWGAWDKVIVIEIECWDEERE